MTINGFTERELEEDDEEDLDIVEELSQMDMEEFFEDHPELEDCDLGEKSILLFSFTASNVQKIPETYFHYIEKNGESLLQGLSMNGIEYDFAIFLEKQGEDFVLLKETRVNDFLVSTRKENISREEVLNYVCEDDYEGTLGDDVF